MQILAALLGRRDCKQAIEPASVKPAPSQAEALPAQPLHLVYPYYLHSRAPLKQD